MPRARVPMIAAENQGQVIRGERNAHSVRERGTGGGDLRKVLGVGRPLGSRLLLLHRDVSVILDFVAERRHARVEIGHAQRGGSHVDAAPVLPQVERRSDDGNVRARHDSPLSRTGAASILKEAR